MGNAVLVTLGISQNVYILEGFSLAPRFRDIQQEVEKSAQMGNKMAKKKNLKGIITLTK